MSAEFWEKWSNADELEKVDLVETLTLPSKKTDKHGTASLLNSYLVDLHDYLKDIWVWDKEKD